MGPVPTVPGYGQNARRELSFTEENARRELTFTEQKEQIMKENTEANTEPKAGVKAEPKAEEELRRLREVQTESRKVFDGVLLHVRQDTVRLPNGASSIREVIRHVGAVCVIPVTEDGGVIMERQYRYPLDRVILEIPAGKLDAPEEDRLSAIRRELREETGYTADEWIPLGDFHPAPAYSDEYITMYLARGLHPGKQALDADEFLDLYTIPLAELVREVMDGRISDAKTQVAVLKAARLLGL